jgi:hypothetical protein
LQGVILALTAQIVVRQAAQLAIDDGHQLIESGLVTIAPTSQELGYAVWWLH